MVGLNPLEFLEEVQYEYMINVFGEIVDYDKILKLPTLKMGFAP